MGEAYAFAMGKAPPPQEWILLNYLDRFGVQAVFGRQVTPREMRRMTLVENIVNIYRENKRVPIARLAAWIKENPDKYRLLKEGSMAWQQLQR